MNLPFLSERAKHNILGELLLGSSSCHHETISKGKISYVSRI
jgi:hypothetical protein